MNSVVVNKQQLTTLDRLLKFYNVLHGLNVKIVCETSPKSFVANA